MVRILISKNYLIIKIRYIPDSFITGLSELLNVFDLVNTIKSLTTKPTLNNIAQTALNQSRSVIANSVSNNGNTIVQTIDSAGSALQACMTGGVACAIQVVKNIGIPLLRKANNGEIEVGEINQCSEAEKMDAYLYADCEGRIIKEKGEKVCRIDYGGQIEIGIFYYKPYPYKGFITFAEIGGKGTIPREFKLEISAKKTSGHLSMHIPEGNGKGYIAGVAIPCWYYFD